MKQDIMTRNYYRRHERKSSDEIRKLIAQREALIASMKSKKQSETLYSEIDACKQILIDRGEEA